MWQRRVLAVALAALAAPAAVAQRDAVAELQLQLRGDLAIGPDGRVGEYQIKTPVAPDVAAAIDRNIQEWQFLPIIVDGKAVAAKTTFHLSLNATPASDQPKGNYRLRIDGVSFGEPPKPDEAAPPHYPISAVQARIGANVVLNVHLDEQGRVVEAQPYQTSLDRRTRNEKEAAIWRTRFEAASIAAVKTWRYDVAEQVDGKPVDTWVRIPFRYTMVPMGSRPPSADQWRAFIPGPIHARADQAAGLADNRDLSAMKEDDVVADSRFRLKEDVLGKLL